MAQTGSAVGSALLDFEKLDVYRVALEFRALARPLVRGHRVGALRDQLDRASTSIALNIAEGTGRRTSAERAAFYGIARGSAMECAAILDLLDRPGVQAAETHRHAREKLIRIVQMLSRLVVRCSPV